MQWQILFMLKLGPDSGTLGSETGIYSKTIKKVQPVDSAHGEMRVSFCLCHFEKRHEMSY